MPGDRDRLQEHYESLGFLNATVRVSFTLNAEETAATLAVLAREGPRVVVGEITVVGNREWSQEDILSELPLKPGMPYSEAARLKSQSRLSDLESPQRPCLRRRTIAWRVTGPHYGLCGRVGHRDAGMGRGRRGCVTSAPE